MKNIFCIVLFLFVITGARADDKPAMIKRYRYIIKLIQADKAEELSKLVAYPLKRENPLKDIANAKEFIAYYPVMFDAAFKKKLSGFRGSAVMEQHGNFGLVGEEFSGEMWLNEKGLIMSVNYISKREQDLKDQLTKSIQSKMHPSINHWDQNVLVLQSPKLLIRIDRTIGNNIRYASWSKGRPTSEKPDLVLNNGLEEAQGTMGGWTYTFKSGDWTYVIDDVEMCEKDDQCGYFLNLSFKGQDKSSTKLKSIK